MRIRKLALAALGLAVSLAAATAPTCADDIRNTAIVQPSRADGPGWRRASDMLRAQGFHLSIGASSPIAH